MSFILYIKHTIFFPILKEYDSCSALLPECQYDDLPCMANTIFVKENPAITKVHAIRGLIKVNWRKRAHRTSPRIKFIAIQSDTHTHVAFKNFLSGAKLFLLVLLIFPWKLNPWRMIMEQFY